MSDISKKDLRKEILEILEGADLDTLSSKKVRQQLEEKLKLDLTDRKKEIDELVMDAVENKPQVEDKEKSKKDASDSGEENTEEKEPAKKKAKANKSDESSDDGKEEESAEEKDDEEEGEEEEEEEDELQPDDDDDDAPKRKGRQSARKPAAAPEAKARGRPSRSDLNKKSLAENSSESEEEKSEVSEESEEESDPPAVKKAPRGPKPKAKKNDVKPVKAARDYDSESEYEEFDEDSSNSSNSGSDEDYSPGKKSPGKKKAVRGGRGRGAVGGRKRKMDSSDPEDSDEDWKKSTKQKRTPNAKKGERTPKPKVKKDVKLSAELSDIMGVDSMPRPEVVKKMWAIIKERNLYDPKNKQFAVCDEQLQKVFGVKRFRTFGMMKYLKSHFTE